MTRPDDTELSRVVSHALRHEPGRYGLTPDEAGWVSVQSLLRGLRQLPQWGEVSEADLRRMLATSPKQRHEIRDGKIRAAYGHSVSRKLVHEPHQPPAVLFHGTSPAAAEVILCEGLRPMTRQYVHLSPDPQVASLVGRRKSSNPVVLRIDAAGCASAGAVFSLANDKVWLVDAVAPDFITLEPDDEDAPKA